MEEVKENERKLKEIINSNAYDINNCVNLYKEVLSSKVAINHKMVEDALAIISKKKEEGWLTDLKKMSAKDKNNIIKILEEIKLNGWKIGSKVMDRFYELSK